MKRALASVLCSACLAAQAQTFPTKPVTMIVPFPAGGPSDALARVLGVAMAGPLGQQIVIENVGGAGGTLGAHKGAQAKPDGYTLVMNHIGVSTSVTLYRKLPYDPVEAFEPVGMIGAVPMTIVTRKDMAARDARELLDHIRQNSKTVSYANGGVGSASHLCGLLFMTALKTEMNVISYRGAGPAMNDVLGGRIDVLCDQTSTTTSHIKSGAIKAYAVTVKSRLPSLPELPTLHDAGLRDFELATWYGLAVQKGTPAPIVERHAAALKAALADATFQKRLAEFGAEPSDPVRATPAGFNTYIRSEVAKWAPIIKAAGVYAD
jgi:tripartite-type tricarboxylate transporter receptor subunit TctC